MNVSFDVIPMYFPWLPVRRRFSFGRVTICFILNSIGFTKVPFFINDLDLPCCDGSYARTLYKNFLLIITHFILLLSSFLAFSLFLQ